MALREVTDAKQYNSDDEYSAASYDFADPMVSGSGERAFVARIPGKKVLEDDEVPDVLYTVHYRGSSGKLLESQYSHEPDALGAF